MYTGKVIKLSHMLSLLCTVVGCDSSVPGWWEGRDTSDDWNIITALHYASTLGDCTQ